MTLSGQLFFDTCHRFHKFLRHDYTPSPVSIAAYKASCQINGSVIEFNIDLKRDTITLIKLIFEYIVFGVGQLATVVFALKTAF